MSQDRKIVTADRQIHRSTYIVSDALRCSSCSSPSAVMCSQHDRVGRRSELRPAPDQVEDRLQARPTPRQAAAPGSPSQRPRTTPGAGRQLGVSPSTTSSATPGRRQTQATLQGTNITTKI